MNDNERDDEELELEDIVISNSYGIGALINILERKGLITKDELLDEIERLEEEGDYWEDEIH